MMAKIVKAKSFQGVINYVLDKNKGTQIIDSNGLRLKDKASIINSFELQASMNNHVSKPVYHISLGFSAQDKEKLSNELMARIARDYMELMRIIDTQYIIGRHFDKEHPHIHLVCNRTSNNSKVISDSNDRLRSEKICKELTVKYGLYFANNGKENVKENRLRKQSDKTKYEIYHVLKSTLPQCNNWAELKQKLHESGIITTFRYNGNTNKIQGVSFTKDNYSFNGSKIDRQFSFSKIDSVLCLNSKQLDQCNYQSPIISSISRNSPAGVFVPDCFGISPEYSDDDETEDNKKRRKKLNNNNQQINL